MYRLNVDPTDYGFPEWVAQSSLKEERMEELSVPWERGEELQAFYREYRVIEKVNSLPLGLLLERHELRGRCGRVRGRGESSVRQRRPVLELRAGHPGPVPGRDLRQ